MDKNKLELFNVLTDLRRSIMELVQKNNHQSTFISNIQKNYPNLLQIDPNINKFIDMNLLQNTSLPPREKAEYLLMSANRLQHYLLQ